MKYGYKVVNDNLIRTRLLEIDCCMKFVNSDILNQNISDYYSTINDYCWFVARKDYIDLDPFIMWQAMTCNLRPTEALSSETLLMHKNFLIELRDHLIMRLESLEDGFEIEGKLKVDFHYYELSSLFVVPDLLEAYTTTFYLSTEQKRIDEKLFHLIYDLNLESYSIKKCLKCENYFYQATKRKKRYCAPKCAGAVRQQKYTQKLKEKND